MVWAWEHGVRFMESIRYGWDGWTAGRLPLPPLTTSPRPKREGTGRQTSRMDWKSMTVLFHFHFHAMDGDTDDTTLLGVSDIPTTAGDLLGKLGL